MLARSLGRIVPRSGIAAIAWLACNVSVAIGDTTPSLQPVGHDQTCARSTDTVIQLATIENSEERSFQCLGLAVEGGAVRAVRLETHRLSSSSGDRDSVRVAIAEFDPAVVESNRGAVLDGIPGFDAITLKGNLSAPASKTPLVTSYLYNGFTGEYRSCQIALDRSSETGWRLVNRFDQTISRIVVKTRQMPVIGAYGIASLDGACP